MTAPQQHLASGVGLLVCGAGEAENIKKRKKDETVKDGTLTTTAAAAAGTGV